MIRSTPPIPPRLRVYLEDSGLAYELVTDSHSEVGSWADRACGTPVATWVVAVGERYALMVLPADRAPALHQLNADNRGKRIRLASEAEIRHLFPDCDPSDVPPAGPVYGLPTYVSDALASATTFRCGTGTPTAQLCVDREAFEALVQPRWLKLPDDD